VAPEANADGFGRRFFANKAIYAFIAAIIAGMPMRFMTRVIL